MRLRSRPPGSRTTTVPAKVENEPSHRDQPLAIEGARLVADEQRAHYQQMPR